MHDLERLKALLSDDTLLHPVSDTPSIIDFAAATHDFIGASDAPLSRNAAIIRALIGEPSHLVFALVDGFGMNFIDALPEDAFLRRSTVTEMRTVFPSTTSTVLTTLATGAWPARHAVTGWHVLIPSLNTVSIIISFRSTPDNKSLSSLGIHPTDAYPTPSRIGSGRRDIARNSVYLLPKHITRTAYSSYWADGIWQSGYETLREAVDAIVLRAQKPGVTYLYMHHVDSSAHEHGTTHPTTLKAAYDADRALERLAAALPRNARLVMTADHGHLDVSPEKTYVLSQDDELLSYCQTKPSGDIRVMYARVHPDDKPAFRSAARSKLGDDFVALDIEDAERLKLFGPEPLSRHTKQRVGNIMLLSINDAALDIRPALGEKSATLYSHHSGLTPAEMRIPLVVA